MLEEVNSNIDTILQGIQCIQDLISVVPVFKVLKSVFWLVGYGYCMSLQSMERVFLAGQMAVLYVITVNGEKVFWLVRYG